MLRQGDLVSTLDILFGDRKDPLDETIQKGVAVSDRLASIDRHKSVRR